MIPPTDHRRRLWSSGALTLSPATCIEVAEVDHGPGVPEIVGRAVSGLVRLVEAGTALASRPVLFQIPNMGRGLTHRRSALFLIALQNYLTPPPESP